MDDKNNEVNRQTLDDIGFIQKPGVGSHSYTVEETRTMNFIDRETLKKRIHGENLELKNNYGTRYFLIENGTLIKYNVNASSIYEFDLETMTWIISKQSPAFYFNSDLRFQELMDFKDYYEDGKAVIDDYPRSIR